MSSWEISPTYHGSTLLEFLKSVFPDQSLKQLKKNIDAGFVSVNGKPERFSTRPLAKGDRVLWKERSTSIFKPEREQILFEDKHYFIYNKPIGASSDDPRFLKDLETLSSRLILAHRLDKETSGALLFAKSESAFQKIVQDFKSFNVKKEYLAWVQGLVKESGGKIDAPIGLVWKEGTQKRYGVVPSGQSALTEWEVLERKSNKTLLLCKPVTGRTHQLRVHLASIGHPILGDLVYSKTKDSSSRLFLHAWKLTLPNFNSSQTIQVTAPLFKDWLV